MFHNRLSCQSYTIKIIFLYHYLVWYNDPSEPVNNRELFNPLLLLFNTVNILDRSGAEVESNIQSFNTETNHHWVRTRAVSSGQQARTDVSYKDWQ